MFSGGIHPARLFVAVMISITYVIVLFIHFTSNYKYRRRLSLVTRNVKIGRSTKIWNLTYIGKNSTIGDNTIIGSLSHIDYSVKIGNNCNIEGSVYIPPLTIIGDNVFVGPGVIITNDPFPMSKINKGVNVEDNVTIGAGAIIKAGVTIKKNSVIGMGSIVTKDVPSDSVIYGNPAKIKYTKLSINISSGHNKGFREMTTNINTNQLNNIKILLDKYDL